MSTFAEITKRVHSINDLILSDMKSGRKNYTEESLVFRNQLLATTNWFSRVSYANKKRFVLALLDDVNSVWTLSLILKAIWNCRPKDAVISVCQPRVWSSYDQVPMDHNRTALPLSTLKEVMTADRKRFMSLEPESQARFLSELLMISGGPIMWEVLQRAQSIYEDYLEAEIRSLEECNVITEPVPEKIKAAPEPTKKENTPRKTSTGQTDSGKLPGQAQKDLEANLAAWNANLKSIRDRMKLEELEMMFHDGTTKRVWKVNRPKPESTETVDFVQLLPSEIAKKILSYLSTTQLSECSRVNKYWSYLVDELKNEITARQKINIELEKLREIMLHHDTSLDLLLRPECHFNDIKSSPELSRKTKAQASAVLSTKTNRMSYMQPTKPNNSRKRVPQKPIKNLFELSERLQRRGAADENIWKWCKNVLTDNQRLSGEECKKSDDGLVLFEPTGFPCPLMKYSLNVPLNSPLTKNSAESAPVKTKVNISSGDGQDTQAKQRNKRYNLWSRDMSGLYPVCKLPSYQFPH